jgi:hypothetical protein
VSVGRCLSRVVSSEDVERLNEGVGTYLGSAWSPDSEGGGSLPAQRGMPRNS